LQIYSDAGLDVNALRAEIGRLPGLTTPFGIKAYRGGTYKFDTGLWQQFYELRSQMVFDSLETLTGQLRQAGYRIGMDVFAPFMSQFVGQDIPKLSTLCDFIKPMMYRATIEPAGLTFELDAMLKATGASSTARVNYEELLGLDGGQRPFDLGFASRDLAWLSDACGCAIQAGMEINWEAGVAEVDPAYIRQTMDAFADATPDGFVMAWDLMEAPDENIEAVANWLGTG